MQAGDMVSNQDKEDLENTECNVTENTEKPNPWSALTTITTFDQGNNVNSTICQKNNGNQCREIICWTQSFSYIIDSFFKLLYTVQETDGTYEQHLYTVLCEQLNEIKVCDGPYFEFEAFRKEFSEAFFRLVSTVSFMIENKRIQRSLRYHLMPKWSRYHDEFEEKSLIANGGFGKVYKALHHLDGIEYAIKKIILRSNHTKAIDEYLNEVKTLAKLNHANIISYKAAWIEPVLPCFSSKASIDCGSSISSNVTTSDLRPVRISCIEKIVDILSDDSSEMSMATEQSILQEQRENSDSSDIVSFRDNSDNEKSNNFKDKESKDETKETDMDIHTYDESSSQVCAYTNANLQYSILYIQMTLCEQTLGQWMRARLTQTPEPMISAVLQQILHGVDYIHSRNIVHHDIKPSNIFMSTSGQLQVQLGDFGLACLQKETHHSIIGTRMYAAPEQLNGICDPKSDIYSVGIILTELLIPTRTLMELSNAIGCLKRGNIPQTVPVERHKWAHLIIQMVQNDPAKRPCPKQLLRDLENDKDSRIINELKRRIEDLIQINHDKDTRIKELEDEIVFFRKQIAELKAINV